MGRFRIIVFIVLAAVIAVFAINLLRTEGLVMSPQGDLRRVYYSNGGGMEGGFDSRELQIHDDGTATLTTEYASWHGARTRTCVYEVGAELVARMRKLVDDYELYKASERPDSQFFAYDADTWHITLGYEGNTYDFNENQELTREESEGVREMLKLFDEMSAVEPESDTLAPREVVMTVDGYTYTFLVNDSQAATDLCELCPMDLTGELEGEELFIALPDGLDVGDCEQAEGGGRGDLLYDPDLGELRIETVDYEEKDGLYKLGEMEWPSLDLLIEAGEFECHFYTYANEDY